VNEDAAPAPPADQHDAPPVETPFRWTDALIALLLTWLGALPLLAVLDALPVRDIADALLLLFGGLLTGVASLVVARWRHGAAGRLIWGWRRPNLADVGIGVAAALLAFLAVGVIVWLLTLGGEAPEVQTGIREAAANRAALPFLAIAAVVVVPIAEELLYRGLLFQGLRTRLGRWPAIGMSGFVFGLLHVQWGNLEGTLLLLAAFYPLGMWLAWLFDRRGTLVVPIVAHMAYNGINLGLLLAGRG
jgi:membrane protease YdiL (CAAX protease family)